jgi:hypothetical protein
MSATENYATRTVTLQMEVRVPVTASDSEVETALNRALDESGDTGLDWGDWEVGALTVTNVTPDGVHGPAGGA